MAFIGNKKDQENFGILGRFLKHVAFKDSDATFIPTSSLSGEN
jgi:translation elongation factor EF-1alpha